LPGARKMGQSAVGCRATDFQGKEASPAACALARCPHGPTDCTVAVVRRLLDVTTPFGKAEEANCKLLLASKEGDLEGIREAMATDAEINTRLPMWLQATAREEDTEEEGFGFNREDTFAETIESMGNENSMQTNGMGFTPLMYASYEGNVEAVRLLLSLRAHLDLCDADGMQAIHLTAHTASAECFRVLLESGANPAAKDDSGRDALQCVPFDRLSCHSSKREWMALQRIASQISAVEQTNEAAAVTELSTKSMASVSASYEQCSEVKDATSNS